MESPIRWHLIRVVLHEIGSKSPTQQTYDRMHEELSIRGYERKIEGESGRIWDLPDATYFAAKAESTKIVRNEVFRIAKGVWSPPQGVSVIVADFRGAAWINLDESEDDFEDIYALLNEEFD